MADVGQELVLHPVAAFGGLLRLGHGRQLGLVLVQQPAPGVGEPVLNTAHVEVEEQEQAEGRGGAAHQQGGGEAVEGAQRLVDGLQHHDPTQLTSADVVQRQQAAAVARVAEGDPRRCAGRPLQPALQRLGVRLQGAVDDGEALKFFPVALALEHAQPLLPALPLQVPLVHRQQQLHAEHMAKLGGDVFDLLAQLQVADQLAVHPPGVDHAQGEGAEGAQLDAAAGRLAPRRVVEGVALDQVAVALGVVGA